MPGVSRYEKKIICYSILSSFFHFTWMRWKYIWDSRFSDSLSLPCFWFFFMDCPDRGVNKVLYCREHQYVKDAGTKKKIIFIFPRAVPQINCKRNEQETDSSWIVVEEGHFILLSHANPVWFFGSEVLLPSKICSSFPRCNRFCL